MKDWTVYIENEKIQAWDVTREDRHEIDDLLNGLGFEIIAQVAFMREAHAIDYGKFIEGRKK